MQQAWLKGLEQDEKDIVVAEFKSCPVLRKRMKLVLQKKIDDVVSSSLLKSDYDCPNWDKKQADTVGYTRALREVYNLL